MSDSREGLTMNISAIILAGGNSSRMKFNKEEIKIDGEELYVLGVDSLLAVEK